MDTSSVRYEQSSEHESLLEINNFTYSRGYGAVGREVASNIKDPKIESRHQQDFFNCQLLFIKDENTRKRDLEWPV